MANQRFNSLLSTLAALVLLTASQAGYALDPAVAAQLANPDRPQAEKDVDSMRKPLEVLEFTGVKPGMTVLDLFGGGGYYTELLSAAVGPKGKVLYHNIKQFWEGRGGATKTAMTARAERLKNVELWVHELNDLKTGQPVDLVMLSLFFHDVHDMFGADTATKMIADLYASLKPGGALVLIDHVGAPANDNKPLHRIDPEIARKAILAAGFKIEATSDLLRNPDDDHSLGVREDTIRRKTDQFIFKAVKPAN